MRCLAWLLFIAGLSGCAHIPTGLNDTPRVVCYDTNRDGVIDFELHIPKKSGEVSQWALEDTNYDGFYDYLIIYGSTIATRQAVHIPVPRNIQISTQDFLKAHPKKPH
jgi:hypothetical protein